MISPKLENIEITNEVIETFINGHDPQERIVNLDYKYQDNFISVFYRNENDEKCCSREPFYPFVWAKLDACVRLCDGDRKSVSSLMKEHNIGVKSLCYVNKEGEEIESLRDGYRYMFYAKKPMSYSDFLNFFKLAKCPVYSKQKSDYTAKKDDKLYISVTPQEQYLISTGKRFFKGYDDYNQLLRMIFDLETEGLDPKKCRIKLDGIRLNRPITIEGKTYQSFDKIFRISGETEEEKNKSELQVIETMIKIIYTFKPDVISAHNGEAFDWPFLIERCNQLGTSIEAISSKYFNGESIGKNKRESILKLGGEIEKFQQTIVPNTIVTDSLHAVRRAQATDSSFKKGSLKYATKYLNLVKKNRVYTPGDKIDEILCDLKEHYAYNDNNGDWYIYNPKSPNGKENEFKLGKEGDNPFIMRERNYIAEGYSLVNGKYIIDRYLLDDLWECDVVEYSLNGTDFMLTKMIPVSFQKCCTMGTAGQWKMIMLAWSYEHNLAIPFAENTGSFTGGLSRLLKTGFIGKWVDNNGVEHGNEIDKLDYNSLYPSITLTWGVEDEKDIMGVTLKILSYILTTREIHKSLKKKAGKIVDKYEELINNNINLTEQEIIEYNNQKSVYRVEDNRQANVKKLGNSFFGAYGSNNGAVYPWKSPDCAERITCIGRQCLRLMICFFSEISQRNNLNDEDYNYVPIVGDTDGFNFRTPNKYRYTEENPYISNGLSRCTKEGQKYTYDDGDIAEFNDKYMIDFHYSPIAVQKMGLDRDEKAYSTINFSRKNYSDNFPWKPYPDDVKLVGNSIKSKKMASYMEIFLDKAIRLLLQNKGQEFINYYYQYIEKIYNCQIPLKDIASKGKIKKTIEEYKKDCNTLTKSGNKKSRQAWMELAIQNNLNVNLGETIYYINTGKKKGDSDVKRITHYYVPDENSIFGGNIDIKKQLEKEWKKDEKEGKGIMAFDEWVNKNHKEVSIEDEIILNCVLLPNEIVESEKDIYCDDGKEYNITKYIEQFNKRITPLLVCFSKDIRSRILINNPSEKEYFTEEEATLCSGQPNKPGDQDTYEQLMTMEDKEIKFWLKHPEWKIPFLEECHMDWEKIKTDYINRKEEERKLGIDKIRKQFDEIINGLSNEEIDDLVEEGNIPTKLNKIMDIDPLTNNFISKEFPDYVLCTIYDLFDIKEQKLSINETEE